MKGGETSEGVELSLRSLDLWLLAKRHTKDTQRLLSRAMEWSNLGFRNET